MLNIRGVTFNEYDCRGFKLIDEYSSDKILDNYILKTFEQFNDIDFVEVKYKVEYSNSKTQLLVYPATIIG